MSIKGGEVRDAESAEQIERFRASIDQFVSHNEKKIQRIDDAYLDDGKMNPYDRRIAATGDILAIYSIASRNSIEAKRNGLDEVALTLDNLALSAANCDDAMKEENMGIYRDEAERIKLLNSYLQSLVQVENRESGQDEKKCSTCGSVVAIRTNVVNRMEGVGLVSDARQILINRELRSEVDFGFNPDRDITEKRLFDAVSKLKEAEQNGYKIEDDIKLQLLEQLKLKTNEMIDELLKRSAYGDVLFARDLFDLAEYYNVPITVTSEEQLQDREISFYMGVFQIYVEKFRGLRWDDLIAQARDHIGYASPDQIENWETSMERLEVLAEQRNRREKIAPLIQSMTELLERYRKAHEARVMRRGY